MLGERKFYADMKLKILTVMSQIDNKALFL